MQLKSKAINILASYAYLKDNPRLTEALLLLSTKGYINLLIDSGAFTAHAAGKPINPKEYITFCKRIEGKVWQYIMLDIIGQASASMLNFKKMLKAGLNPMGVWTKYDTVHNLKELAEHNDHVCIAGGVGTESKKMVARFRQAVQEVPTIKIHGLAYVKVPQYYKLPLYSVDSSSFTAGVRFGTLPVFNYKTGLMTSFTVSQLKVAKVSTIPEELKKLWVSLGLKPSERMNKELYTGNFSVQAVQAAKAHLDMMRYAKRPAVDRQYFLAIGKESELNTVIVTNWSAHVNSGKVNFKEVEKICKELRELLKTDVPKYTKLLMKYAKEGAHT